jgi:hypothetical protein
VHEELLSDALSVMIWKARGARERARRASETLSSMEINGRSFHKQKEVLTMQQPTDL